MEVPDLSHNFKLFMLAFNITILSIGLGYFIYSGVYTLLGFF